MAVDKLISLGFWAIVLAMTLPIGFYEVFTGRIVGPRSEHRRRRSRPRAEGAVLLIFSVIASTWILMLSGRVRTLNILLLPGGVLTAVLLLGIIVGAVLL